jgi:hypothetical protein
MNQEVRMMILKISRTLRKLFLGHLDKVHMELIQVEENQWEVIQLPLRKVILVDNNMSLDQQTQER